MLRRLPGQQVIDADHLVALGRGTARTGATR